MEPDTEYEFSIDAKASGYPERFEVMVGTEPTVEAMTTTIIPAVVVEGYDVTNHTGRFTVPASKSDGKYYIGIHAISDADEFVLTIDNVSVVATAPSAIDEINVERVQDNNYYDLMGRKMNSNNLPAGIYIHNGKKIIVK